MNFDFDREFSKTADRIKVSFIVGIVIKIVILGVVIAGIVLFVRSCNDAGGLVPMFKGVLGI